MTRCWKHVAVLAAWLTLGVVAQAQPGYPSPVGATRLPDPLGYTPGPTPPLVPGAMTPAMAPAGPPPSLNLPEGHTGAFQLENYPTETAFFASIGGQSLKRQTLTHLPIAFTDNQNGGLDTGNVPLGIGTRANGSFNPFITNPTVLPQALNLNDVMPALLNGGRLTVGYLMGNESFEATGFYSPSTSASKEVSNRGRLFVPFGPLNKIPLGFEGNNGLWLQADKVRASFTSELASAEFNYHRWDSGINWVELIVGFRYFYTRESVGIFTDDEAFTTDIFGKPDPKRQATYTATVRNNLIAMQFGGEYSAPLLNDYLGWIWLGGVYKSAIGPNFIDRTLNLTRGDGFQGFNVRHASVRLSGLSEASLFFDFHLLDRLRLRAGYMALWAVNFSTAGAQVEYDLTNQGKRPTDHGSIFYHGPMVELQFLF